MIWMLISCQNYIIAFEQINLFTFLKVQWNMDEQQDDEKCVATYVTPNEECCKFDEIVQLF